MPAEVTFMERFFFEEITQGPILRIDLKSMRATEKTRKNSTTADSPSNNKDTVK
ncbi:hypothetical protein PUN28_006824 [Cardiocondyla obscurior]|uniref:Uncharacterized protein n=1 Tax=Cardiocondyla obscurior TaxID=286306 RepID=A0AAW2G2V8_9HYME